MKSSTPEQLLERLDWTVLRRLEGLYPGEYRTSFRGDGLDLADLREYQPNDDVRRIDWNVTARLQTPFVRVFQEDRELTAWFIVDLSGSLDAGWTSRRKRDLAIEFTALLARVLTRRGNRVGALLFGHRSPETHPPAGGKLHLLHLISRMSRVRPQTTAAQTDLSAALVTADRTIRRRSLVFLVSDFVSKPGWIVPLGRIARRHEVIACRVIDPLERELQNIGIAVMEDAETGEQVLVDTGQRSIRHAYAQQMAATDEQIVNALSETGVDCVEIGTQDDLLTALLRFSELRRSRALAAQTKEG